MGCSYKQNNVLTAPQRAQCLHFWSNYKWQKLYLHSNLKNNTHFSFVLRLHLSHIHTVIVFDKMSMPPLILFLLKGWFLHFCGCWLDASVRDKRPVISFIGSKRALFRILVDFHLKRLHVSLIVLIGWDAHSCGSTDKHTYGNVHLCFWLKILYITYAYTRDNQNNRFYNSAVTTVHSYKITLIDISIIRTTRVSKNTSNVSV